MQLQFTKMHGLGNDFVVVDAVRQRVELSAEQIRHIADRRRGIGCDQVLLVEPSQRADSRFRYRIFNADGGEVEQCGNGARCFALFVRARGLTDATTIPVYTAAGRIELQVNDDHSVTVNMGVPKFEPAAIPFEASAREAVYSLNLEGREYRFGAVSMGNPHAVLQVADVDTAPVATVGPAIESHPRFPARVNVGFMQIVDRAHIRLRVFERGAGETQACGTGACAAMVVARSRELVDETVTVSLPGGDLVVSWAGENRSVLMTGPATFVFEGNIEL